MTVPGVLLTILTLGFTAAFITATVRRRRRTTDALVREAHLRREVHVTVTADYELISALSANASSGLITWEEALRHLDRDLSNRPHNVAVRRVLGSGDTRTPHDRFMLVLCLLRNAQVLATADLERAKMPAA